MIDAKRLLGDLERLRAELEDDLRARCDEDPVLDAPLREQYREAREAGRTGETYALWRDERLTQVAVAWILGCVFVRFLEDNELVDPPRLSGSGDRRQRALDEHTLYFRSHPTESDREYLLHVFGEVAKLPAAEALFDEKHNPLWTLGPSGDAAGRLLELFQRIDADSGGLVHDFTDPAWDTRFLGDLYQDLSEAARKRYALLQTPEFVEEFILDRTLTPAIEEFGFQEVRLIDPACGSGHFLLGAFRRLDALWSKHEPGTNPRERARRALEQVAGVDVNPFAAAIAHFRLLVAALLASGVKRLADAPAFEIHVAAGDSLLHGKRPGMLLETPLALRPDAPAQHVYETEDAEALRRILGRQYHVVVSNPPYITPKDKALNQAYRGRYGSCHRKYSLAVPFTERFFDLALASDSSGGAAGFVGMITANSFMKREFGKKLIEEFIPTWDLTHVVDTSGAYIPGHGTPTVLLFGRHRKPVDEVVRAVMGIRGEPATPADPAKGLVWSAIVSQIDRLGSQSDFVSVSDVPRERFHKHPWSIRGGGAAELKEGLDNACDSVLREHVESVGFGAITGIDDIYLFEEPTARRLFGSTSDCRAFVIGDFVRDWTDDSSLFAIFPYDETADFKTPRTADQHLWRFRTPLSAGIYFGKTNEERGLDWREYAILGVAKMKTPISIAFSFVASHNHFMLDRHARLFNKSAPIIKLPLHASLEDHLEILGLLNSSTACFWMQQVFHNKGGPGGASSKDEKWHDFYEHDGTKLQRLPIPSDRPLDVARELDALAKRRKDTLPFSLVARGTPSREVLGEARARAEEVRERMIALQEELDWRCYRIYGVVEEALCLESGDPPRIALGERAFEIVLARKLEAGEVETKWFERHGSTPITEIPDRWPAEYRALVQRRIEAIEKNLSVALIEQPEYKRRWNDEPWEEQEARALRGWLLDRMEAPALWSETRLTTTAKLADRLRDDPEFLQVAELYAGRADFELAKLVAELVEGESVPLLAALRYKPPGLRKRRAWEEVWELQRREDAIDARPALPESHPDHLSESEARAAKAREVGEIPVPPKYTSGDFQKSTYWRLRGKLDVPKERFVSLPFCEREADPSLVIGWAGWNALEQSRAVAAYFVQMKEQEGWSAERLTPLLGALLELLPWVKQWHNELNPEFGVGMGDYFEGFIDEEARALSLTTEAIGSWSPPKGRGRRKKSTRKKTGDGGSTGRSRRRKTST